MPLGARAPSHPIHGAQELDQLEAPLKLAVLERPGGGVTVRWIDPAAAFARFGKPALAELGRELAVTCEGIASAALGPDATAA